jgi:hypothetical protein
MEILARDVPPALARVSEDELLERLCDLARSDFSHFVEIAGACERLAMPYEEVVRMVDSLHEQGMLHRVADLPHPRGARVHLTTRGIARVLLNSCCW